MSRTANTGKIRILIVDDSAFMRISLTRLLSEDADLLVVGWRSTAPTLCERLRRLIPRW